MLISLPWFVGVAGRRDVNGYSDPIRFTDGKRSGKLTHAAAQLITVSNDVAPIGFLFSSKMQKSKYLYRTE